MSLVDLFDHEVAIWRPTVTLGPLREEIRTYTAVLVAPGLPNAVINRPAAPLADSGPGLTPTGTRRIYMRPTTEVRLRDLLEIVSGPDEGMIIEVDEPPTRPRGHHVQIDGRVWSGQLPGSAS